MIVIVYYCRGDSQTNDDEDNHDDDYGSIIAFMYQLVTDIEY